MILLETIDDLLRVLLPAAVPREGVETDEEITVYKVAGERIHFGETVAYSPLQLLVSPGEKDLQSHIFWYATEVGPQRYAESAREALSDAEVEVRDMLATSGQLLEADITAMVMSFDQAVAAAIRHMDSAASMRNEKLEDSPFHDKEVSTTQRIREADRELTFVTSFIVESVVDSAIKPKAWLENEMLDREGQFFLASPPSVEAVVAGEGEQTVKAMDCRSHFVMGATVSMVWLPRSWRLQRVHRPGHCLTCVGLGSFGAP